jgi:hypothetical protein
LQISPFCQICHKSTVCPNCGEQCATGKAHGQQQHSNIARPVANNAKAAQELALATNELWRWLVF